MATIQQSIDIRVPIHAVYNRLARFEDYPRFMDEVKDIRRLDDTHLHWTTIMANRPVEWDAEITEQEPDRCIAWHNTSGPTGDGRVELQAVGQDAARVTFTLHSEPEQVPGSLAGNSEQALALQLKLDMARLKDFIEAQQSQAAIPSRAGGLSAGQQEGLAESTQGERGSPRNASVPTSSYAAGSEGFSGEEEPAQPVASSMRAAAGQRNDAAGAATASQTTQRKEHAMQRISEVMTRDIRFVSPQESLQRAAQLMDELNVGALPVCDGERLVGMVTDRDITVRATAAGRAPNDTHVDEVMSTDVRWCFEDQPLDDVMRQMADTQIRRVPVVSHDDAHKLVGIVSLGDLTIKAGGRGQKQEAQQAMEKISTPSEPDRVQQPAQAKAATNATPATSESRISRATGSDTGTATGLAGSDMLDIGRNEASAETGSSTTDMATDTETTGMTGSAGSRQAAREAGGPQPGTAGTGSNMLGSAGRAGTVSNVAAPTGGPSSAASSPDAARADPGARTGVDTGGPSGPSGGVSGSGGAGRVSGKGTSQK